MNEEVLTYDEVGRYYPQPNRKRPIVLIGAKDVGREVLRNKLLALDASRFEVPVPVTSRAPRPTATGQLEQEGRDFHFVTREQFQADVAAYRLAEFGEFDGNLYGTSFESVRRIVQAGRVAILLAHVEAIRVLYESDLKPYFVFVAAPPLDKLRTLRIKLGAARIAVCKYFIKQLNH